jgi:hypothetical protein
VRAVIPIPNTTGNVTVTFGVLSYAGTLQITVLSDPSRVPDVAVLTAALRRNWAKRPADRRDRRLPAPAEQVRRPQAGEMPARMVLVSQMPQTCPQNPEHHFGPWPGPWD